MLIQFDEQIINDVFIPSFTISRGEIVIIQLPGKYFHPTNLALAKILTGEEGDEHVNTTSPFKYVEHFKESKFREYFLPTNIDSYHNKHANKLNPIYKKIYETPWLKSQIKVNTLAGYMRKCLALYTTLSWTNNIIFDLVGVDPQGGQEIYKFVKKVVQYGGAAILIDSRDEFKNDCTTFLKANYVGVGI